MLEISWIMNTWRLFRFRLRNLMKKVHPSWPHSRFCPLQDPWSVLFMLKLFVTKTLFGVFANDITCALLLLRVGSEWIWWPVFSSSSSLHLWGSPANRYYLSSSRSPFKVNLLPLRREVGLLYFDTFHLLRPAHDQAVEAKGGQKGWRLF